MYWIVGCPPGGSAGTSFCSGTEISISRLAIAFPRRVLFILQTCRASGVLALDLVFQNADFFYVKLDGVAMFKKPAELNSAAITDRSGSDKFARHQGLVLGHMRDDLLERKQHALGNALRTHLAVDAHFHLELVGIADLVRGHDPGTQDVPAVKPLAFGGALP